LLAGILPDDLANPALSVFHTGASYLTPLFSRLALDLPAEAWWVSFVILLILMLAAFIDAIEGRVPDPLVFLGLMVATASLGFYHSWPFAAGRLSMGLGVALVLYVLNQLYYASQQRDAIGMGDAKWTALAITGFGSQAALYAWGIGACLGSAWLIIAWIINFLHRLFTKTKDDILDRVHFTPFLFVGFMAGLYWNYLR
jgi:Flp pilus assembly protein protease CpaA